jgi:hypothetical protein
VGSLPASLPLPLTQRSIKQRIRTSPSAQVFAQLEAHPDMPHDLELLPQVCQPHALTPLGWRKMAPAIGAHLRATWRAHVRGARAALADSLYGAFVTRHAPSTLFPPACVLRGTPSCAAVVAAPDDEVVTPDAFAEALHPAHLYFCSGAWRAKCDRLLATLLPSRAAGADDRAAGTALDRATSWFRIGTMPLDYPAVLARHTVERAPFAPAPAPGQPAPLVVRNDDECHPLVFDARAAEVAACVVRLAGLDPATATSAHMDTRGARFCRASELRADKPEGAYVYTVFHWRAAVRSIPPAVLALY